MPDVLMLCCYGYMRLHGTSIMMTSISVLQTKFTVPYARDVPYGYQGAAYAVQLYGVCLRASASRAESSRLHLQPRTAAY